jgi:DNA-binding NarL/FixJ family response regulator
VSAAIALAAGGAAIVVEAPRSSELLAALVDDLRRIGPVELPGIVEDDGLSREERALLELLGSGLSVSAAAAEIHVSRRTAQRLLVRAKAKLGATSTVDAIARAADAG